MKTRRYFDIKGLYRCEICGMEFRNKCNRDKHIKSHRLVNWEKQDELQLP